MDASEQHIIPIVSDDQGEGFFNPLEDYDDNFQSAKKRDACKLKKRLRKLSEKSKRRNRRG